MEDWKIVDLRRQAEAFRRGGTEAHNRRPLRISMDDLRRRRVRRRARAYLRVMLLWEAA